MTSRAIYEHTMGMGISDVFLRIYESEDDEEEIIGLHLDKTNTKNPLISSSEMANIHKALKIITEAINQGKVSVKV